MPPSTMQDLLTQVTSDTTTVAGDNTAITADQAKLTADEATLATDTTTLTTDQAAFSTALAETGPFAMVAADGSSVTIYSSSSAAPGYETQVIPAGGWVPIPAPPVPPPATPSPTPSS